MVALIWAVTTVNSSAVSYQTVSYWDGSTTSSNTILTGISGDLVVGNSNYEGIDQGFVYSIQSQTFSAVSIGTPANYVQAYGISGNQVVGAYGDETNSYGYILNLSTSNLTVLDAGTRLYGISGNYAVGVRNDSESFIYDIGAQDPDLSYFTLQFESNGTSYATTVRAISGNKVVGYYDVDQDDTRGFIYTFTSDMKVGTFETFEATEASTVTQIFGISSDDKLVGNYSEGSTFNSFLIDGAEKTDLSDPDASQTNINGIDGEKAVGSASKQEQTVGVIAQVPEPTTYVLITLGMLVMAVSRCKARFSRQS
ncbi:MAG: hypothetical protein B9S32_02210 [Verrucomicrobia bacterium Tous-C9LFEB]|nr:MAG: hypothetical protein B9S32_02210 [Verrucomicrobia bacterium Tous-C9LFEB]